MIDSEGYRANVGIVIINDEAQVLWAKRQGQQAWQFPQGGIDQGESPEQAMYRELGEEVGLAANDVALVARTSGWLKYEIPDRLIRKKIHPRCVGQKQIWFLLKLLVPDSKVSLFHHDEIEFDQWKWVDYYFPQTDVVEFKRDVYKSALKELSSYI